MSSKGQHSLSMLSSPIYSVHLLAPRGQIVPSGQGEALQRALCSPPSCCSASWAVFRRRVGETCRASPGDGCLGHLRRGKLWPPTCQPAPETCCSGLREPASAWPSGFYSSCDLDSGTLEGSFTDFMGNKKSVRWGFVGLPPPLSLPPATP